MAVTPVKYVLQLINKTDGSVRVNVPVRISMDGINFLPNESGIYTDSNGIAVIEVPTIGNYSAWIDGALNSDYRDQPIIPLENNLIRCIDTDGNYQTKSVSTGTASIGGNGQKINPTGARQSYVISVNTASHNEYYNSNGLVGRIITDGSSTSYLTSSDPRKKSEFKKPSKSEAWNKFKSIYDSFGKFFFNTDTEKEVYGFNAHKLIDNLGDAGSEGEGSRDSKIGEKDDNGVTVTGASVDQSKIVPYLVAVIEELRKENVSIFSRLKALEGK